MAKIDLANGGVAIVDDEDLPAVQGYKWRQSKLGYVIARRSSKEEKSVIMLHRLVLKARDGMVVDHKNHDLMDNRRSNLRECTHAENMCNRLIHKNNKLGVKGVYQDRRRSTPTYRAQIVIGRKYIRLGSFRTIEQAAKAYADAALKYHGEFARLA